jgi:hypothetical protein
MAGNSGQHIHGMFPAVIHQVVELFRLNHPIHDNPLFLFSTAFSLHHPDVVDPFTQAVTCIKDTSC